MNDTTPTPPGNGAPGRLILWACGAFLVPLALTVFSHLFATTYSSAQRLSALEAEFREVKTHLERVEAKIDRLLERR